MRDNNLEPAAAVIEKFGGAPAVAQILKLNRSTVLRWRYSRKRGGTGGLIPQAYFQQLLKLADKKGIKLSPTDFFPGK